MPRPSVEAQRREQILHAACDVIARSGVAELRMADIAKAAGVSSGMIHYYFDSKHEVVCAAFEYNLTNSLQRHQIQLDFGKDPLATLRDLVDSYLPGDDRSVRAWKVWVALWAEAIRDPELQKVNERLYGRWRDVVTDVISRAQRQSLVRDGDPVQMANMLVGMLDGLAVQVLVHAASLPLSTMRETCRVFIDTVLAAR
jgi:AcrR family transcriptional regulator